MSEFLQRRHATVQATRSELDALARAATGTGIAATERLVAGYDNEVHRVGLADGRRVYIRIRRFGRRPFAEELWAMEECRARGVPVPAVLALGEAGGAEAMVLAEASGRPLAELLPRLDDVERRSAFAAVGAVLRSVHEVPAGGFYERHADGSWDFPDWESIAASALENRAAERPQLRAAGLRDAEIDAALAAGERYVTRFPCRAPVLNHGDPSAAHVFVDDDLRVTALLDFGQAQGGPRELDAEYIRREQGTAAVEALLDGYGRDAFGAAAEERIALAGILTGLGYAAFHASIGDADAAAAVVASLRELLALV